MEESFIIEKLRDDETRHYGFNLLVKEYQERVYWHVRKMVIDHEIQLKLQKAILTLPDKQRAVFNMRYFDEMKFSEIEQVTGTSQGALKASYHHAVKKIEKFLNPD